MILITCGLLLQKKMISGTGENIVYGFREKHDGELGVVFGYGESTYLTVGNTTEKVVGPIGSYEIVGDRAYALECGSESPSTLETSTSSYAIEQHPYKSLEDLLHDLKPASEGIIININGVDHRVKKTADL